MRTAAIILTVAALVGCDKSKSAPPAPRTAPITAGTVGGDGVRRVPVTASTKGYSPSEITAKPNEKLILVLTRTAKGDCLEKIVIGDGAPIELPLDTPTDVPVTAPASGKLTFVCGMDMFSGAIVVASS